MEPLVTIAIPTYNRSGLLLEAMASALAQTHANVEVLVSDDASSDDTPEKVAQVKDPRLRYIRQPQNLGMVRNLNALLAEARGEYYVLVSDDDSLLPTFVEEHLAVFRRTPDVMFVHSLPVYFDGTYYTPRAARLPELQPGHEMVLAYWRRQLNLLSCATLFRTRDLKELGGYSTAKPYMHDAAVWQRIAMRGTVGHLPRYLSVYRIHAATLTSAATDDPLGALFLDGIRLAAELAAEAAARGHGGQYVSDLMEASVTWCRRRLATLLFRRAQAGMARSALASEAWRLRRALLADWTFGVPCALAAVLLPYPALNALRAAYYRVLDRLIGPGDLPEPLKLAQARLRAGR